MIGDSSRSWIACTSEPSHNAHGRLLALAVCLLVGKGLLLSAVPASCQVSQTRAVEDSTGGLQRISTPIVRLSSEQRDQVFRSGASRLGIEAQEEISRLLRLLEAASDGLLEIAGIDWQAPRDPSAWVRHRTDSWPDRTPAQEQAILAVLDSEVEVLDALLSTRDRDQAESLRLARQRIRVIPEDRRIFGDIRDRFIAEVLEQLKQISLLQTALGSSGDTEWRFPSELRSPEQIEGYLISKVRFVTDKGQRLSE